MGLLTTLARTVTRGAVQALKKQTGSVVTKTLRQEALLHQTPFAKLAKEPPTQKWLNFAHTSFYYNSLAANLRRNATKSFLSRNTSKTPLIAFAGFLVANHSNQQQNPENVNDFLGDLNIDDLWKNENLQVFPQKREVLDEVVSDENDDIIDEVVSDENDDIIDEVVSDENDDIIDDLEHVDSDDECLQQVDDSNSVIVQCSATEKDIGDDEDCQLENILESNHQILLSTVDDSLSKDVSVPMVQKESLKNYLDRNKDMEYVKRLALFCCLLDDVAFFEHYEISHSSLNSDNIFVIENEIDGGFDVFLPCSNKDGKMVNNTKADAFTCGCLAYEIFDKPFAIVGVNHDNKVLKKIVHQLIDEVISKLLWFDPVNRLSVNEAAIIITLILYAPPKWMDNPEMVPNIAIQSWIERMSINIDSSEIFLKFVFSSNITSIDVQSALFSFKKM